MNVKFYGVRGSIASAGDETRRYGGNTSCVTVQAGDELLVFDAGTGIRRLGAELGPMNVKAKLFFSHLHWDHIQGFPFFTPAFVPGNQLDVFGVQTAQAAPVKDALSAQMKPPSFPVPLDIMQADLVFRDIPHNERITFENVEVRHATVDHPNGCVAYRVDHGGRSVVYATDLEHGGEVNNALIDLCAGADALIYDAMYTPEEYDGEVGPPRHGWGHSTFDAGADLADAAGVKQLVLFHHDPGHGDVFLDNLGARARRRFSNTVLAKEGLELAL